MHVANPAAREIKKLTKTAQAQVITAINGLAHNPTPNGIEKLQARPGFFRLRSGDFRIIYHVKRDSKLVVILVVRDRKDAIKGLEDLDGKLAIALTHAAGTILHRSAVQGTA